jgi:hypothetical protein
VSFDYEAPDVPASAVADVVAEISSHGIAPPPTEEQLEQRWLDNQIYLAQCRERDERRSFEYQQEQAAKAERDAAIAAEAAREKAKIEARERSDRIARETRDREVRNLQLQVARHQSWQRDVDRAVTNRVHQQRTQALLADLERAINPPPPPPEPETEMIYRSEDDWGSPHLGPNFNVKWWSRPRSEWPD